MHTQKKKEIKKRKTKPPKKVRNSQINKLSVLCFTFLQDVIFIHELLESDILLMEITAIKLKDVYPIIINNDNNIMHTRNSTKKCEIEIDQK